MFKEPKQISDEMPRMMSIREVARTGVLSEHALRLLERQGKLPCIHIGKKALVNYTRLMEILRDL